MAQTGQQNTAGTRHDSQVVGGIRRRNHGVLVAPQQQRGRGYGFQARHRVAVAALLHALNHRGPHAGRAQHVLVACEHSIAQARIVAISRRQTQLQGPLRQGHTDQAQQRRHLKGFLRACGRIWKTIGCDQHQAADALRLAGGQAPGQSPAHRVANEHAVLHAQVVQHRQHAAHISGFRIVIVCSRAAQAKPGNVKPDHPVLALQNRGPGIPGLQAGTKAMQQNHGAGFTRTRILQVDALPIDLKQLRARLGIADQQLVRRLVRRPGQPQAQQQQHSSHGAASHGAGWLVSRPTCARCARSASTG